MDNIFLLITHQRNTDMIEMLNENKDMQIQQPLTA